MQVLRIEEGCQLSGNFKRYFDHYTYYFNNINYQRVKIFSI